MKNELKRNIGVTMNKIDILKQIIDECNKIVFLEVLEFQLKVEFLILEVLMDYIIKNMIIHLNKY